MPLTNLLLCPGLLCLILLSSIYATAKPTIELPLDSSLGLRLGNPSTQQNVSINTREFYLRKDLNNLELGLLKPSVELGFTRLEVGEESAYAYSLGPSFTIPVMGTRDILSLIGHSKIHWLTQYDFGRKHYGGPVQASYALGCRARFTQNLYAEYLWQHVSNGDRYEHNPSLETHNIGFGVGF